MPSKSLPSRPSLDHLKHQARDLLISHRAGNTEALQRIQEHHPRFTQQTSKESESGRFTLADAQCVVAREYGFESWPKLRRYLTTREQQLATSSPVVTTATGEDFSRIASRFLEYACPDHHVRGGPAHVMAQHAAEALLKQHPELPRHNLCTAVVCGELEVVEALLAESPQIAVGKSATADPARAGAGASEDLFKERGPKGWEPLLYLAFTRLSLPGAIENAVPIARMLLNRGADPNAWFMAGDSRYTALTGVIGEGEENRPPHFQRDALARVLMEHGADPRDTQVLYNLHFSGKILWYLRLACEITIKSGRASEWADPEWRMFDMGVYGTGARYLLGIAVNHNDLELAEWCLAHGANPNAAPASARNQSKGTLHEEALARGYVSMAELLARFGAQVTTPKQPSAEEQFAAACVRRDEQAARELLRNHTELLSSPHPMFFAAERDEVDVVRFLLELGVSPDIQTHSAGPRPLHIAAYSDAPRVVELLLQHGAQVDAIETTHHGTPLWWAIWGNKRRPIEILRRVSRDVRSLAFLGEVTRLRGVLQAHPELAKASGTSESALMHLPPDDEKATEIVKLFLELGIDPAVKTEQRLTAADLAERRGLSNAALLLRHASNPPQPPEAASSGGQLYEHLARDLAVAYETGEAGAIERLNRHYNRSFNWEDIRAEIGRNVYKVRQAKGRAGCFELADAQAFVARHAGFPNWNALLEAAGAGSPPPGAPYSIRSRGRIAPRRSLTRRDWDEVLSVMREQRLSGLDANGQMTDEILEQVSHLDHVTELNLGGSRQLTDAGLRPLAGMPQLRRLNLSGAQITDRGLEVLQHLRSLQRFQLTWQGTVTDAGVAHLSACEALEDVNLLGTPVGDGAIRALRGKNHLRSFKTGRMVTDAGLALLSEFPVFKTWKGGTPEYDLLSADAGPNHLLIDGPFTNEGLASLAALEGLFGLSFFWHVSAMTPEGLKFLPKLPQLGYLGCEGKLCDDLAMQYIGSLPNLRMLMAQGTVATDEGFENLSRSQTLEYLWTRECPNLGNRGFTALSHVPTLRGLAMSCKNVDDAALALLPKFPALRELMPMDVKDAGFRHVGQCVQLEKLTCMYCRDTTDAATEQIRSLSRLRYYYAGLTQITDRSLEILGTMHSVESIDLYECKGVTDAGLKFLVHLPRLKKLALHGLPGVSLAGTKALPAQVEVEYSL